MPVGVDEDFEALGAASGGRSIPPRPPTRIVHVPSDVALHFDRGDWIDDTKAALGKLWVLGFSAAAIAERLGFTKNAIVGKVHRIGLESRPDPIIRSSKPKPAKISAAPRVTLPKLMSVEAPPKPEPLPPSTPRFKGLRISARPAFIDFRATLPRPEPRPKFVADAGYPLGPSLQPCQWIVRDGDVARPWVMCGVTRAVWPYCGAHMKRAYGRQAERDAEAA